MPQPDLWEQIQQQRELIYPSLDQRETNRFEEHEKPQLRLSISEFQLLVEKTFQPSEEEHRQIVERLNYLSQGLDRLNHIDWKSLALSTILSISIALSLDTEKGKILFGLFKKVFSGVVHLLQ